MADIPVRRRWQATRDLGCLEDVRIAVRHEIASLRKLRKVAHDLSEEVDPQRLQAAQAVSGRLVTTLRVYADMLKEQALEKRMDALERLLGVPVKGAAQQPEAN